MALEGLHSNAEPQRDVSYCQNSLPRSKLAAAERAASIKIERTGDLSSNN